MLAGTQHSSAYKCFVTDGTERWHSQAHGPLQNRNMYSTLKYTQIFRYHRRQIADNADRDKKVDRNGSYLSK
jgi:3-hydroxy-3-methylglutaryl CoA synthase